MKKFNANSPLVKAALLLTSSLTVMSGATISPSLPAMGEYFADLDNAEYLVKLALTITAFFIAIGGPFAGILTDRLGRKPLLIGSTLLFACAGSAGYFLTSMWAIIISRALLGIAVAGTMTGVTTIIGDYYQGQQRAKFMGLQGAAMSMGGVIFICIGGVVAEIDWRLPFLIYLVALAFMLLNAVALREPQIEKLEHTNNWGSGRPNFPQAPKEIIGTIFAISLFYNMAFLLIPVQLPFYLKDLVDASPAASGMAIGGSTLAGAVASSQYGAFKQKLDYGTIVIIALLFSAIGLFIIGYGESYRVVLCGLILTGMGFGLILPNLSFWLLTITPPPLRGRAMGGLTTSQFIGQFLSPIIAQPVANLIGLGDTYLLTGILLLQAAVTFLAVKVSTALVAEKI